MTILFPISSSYSCQVKFSANMVLLLSEIFIIPVNVVCAYSPFFCSLLLNDPRSRRSGMLKGGCPSDLTNDICHSLLLFLFLQSVRFSMMQRILGNLDYIRIQVKDLTNVIDVIYYIQFSFRMEFQKIQGPSYADGPL